MILVLAALMRMAILDAQKSTTLNISTSFPNICAKQNHVVYIQQHNNGGKR